MSGFPRPGRGELGKPNDSVDWTAGTAGAYYPGMANETQIDLAPYRMTSGKLASHTSIGSYPLIYVTRSGETLCASCADDNDAEADPIVAADVHWEGPAEHCYCGEPIESAYGDPDAKES